MEIMKKMLLDGNIEGATLNIRDVMEIEKKGLLCM